MKHPKHDVHVPTARELMLEKVFTFSPDTKIATAVEELLGHGFSGAPVVDAKGVLVGILSECDCERVLSEAIYEGWPTGTVREHMTTELEAVDPAADVFTLAAMFRKGQHRRFPVVEGGRLVGLVTRRDLLRALYQHSRAKAEHLDTTYELIAKNRGS